ncbi:hypothetical protein KW076_02235 [Micrococcus porci]|uniref:hypothetical protein n=1 Tax=Micrococcus TaxID=1269 RepID=UPI001CCC860E|nr:MULTISPECIES: hypothetical protein [Micrococcus]MCG7423301.1 hypothetical protein [Micrococcus sp. ACRRV]UBH25036.1 hypothetical protein KW076_02235 [Micrococcus porci]
MTHAGDRPSRGGHPARRALGMFAGAAAVTLGAGGCAVPETVVWGPDGAAVKSATRDVIAAAQRGGDGLPACPGVSVVTGDPAAWRGAGAGEPERPGPDLPAELTRGGEPAWVINVEAGAEAAAPGARVPGSLAFSDLADGGLCLSGLDWANVGG